MWTGRRCGDAGSCDTHSRCLLESITTLDPARVGHGTDEGVDVDHAILFGCEIGRCQWTPESTDIQGHAARARKAPTEVVGKCVDFPCSEHLGMGLQQQAEQRGATESAFPETCALWAAGPSSLSLAPNADCRTV